MDSVETVITGDALDVNEIAELVIAEDVIRAGLATFFQVGDALARIRDQRLYRGSHRTFEAYCEQRWGMSRRRAYEMMGAAAVVDNLSAMAHTPMPSSERQARPLTRLEPEQQVEAWTQAVETAPEGRVTAAHVERVVQELQGEPTPAPVTRRGPQLTSKSNEWYTPEVYIEAARSVLGGIDLDPASCEEANRTVRAEKFFTLEDDGLAQEWEGTVWLNPPYGVDEQGRSNAGRWAARLIEQYEHDGCAGPVEAAILCVNALTSAPWFQQLWDFPICFTDHRIRFDAPRGSDAESAPQNGTAFIYLGPHEHAFIDEFRRFGAIVKRIPWAR